MRMKCFALTMKHCMIFAIAHWNWRRQATAIWIIWYDIDKTLSYIDMWRNTNICVSCRCRKWCRVWRAVCASRASWTVICARWRWIWFRSRASTSSLWALRRSRRAVRRNTTPTAWLSSPIKCLTRRTWWPPLIRVKAATYAVSMCVFAVIYVSLCVYVMCFVVDCNGNVSRQHVYKRNGRSSLNHFLNRLFFHSLMFI